jgi:hypothetical protein
VCLPLHIPVTGSLYRSSSTDKRKKQRISSDDQLEIRIIKSWENFQLHYQMKVSSPFPLAKSQIPYAAVGWNLPVLEKLLAAFSW